MKVQAWICILRYIACVGVNDGEEFADMKIYWTFRWWVIQLTVCTAWDLNRCLASLAWGRCDEVLAHRVCTAWAPGCRLLSPWATGIYSTAFFKMLPSDLAFQVMMFQVLTSWQLPYLYSCGRSRLLGTVQFINCCNLSCAHALFRVLGKSKGMRCLCCSVEGQRWKLVSL